MDYIPWKKNYIEEWVAHLEMIRDNRIQKIVECDEIKSETN
jgi:hypothetical protein